MKLDLETLRDLKNAGFPQNGAGVFYGEGLYEPTLAELIYECINKRGTSYGDSGLMSKGISFNFVENQDGSINYLVTEESYKKLPQIVSSGSSFERSIAHLYCLISN